MNDCALDAAATGCADAWTSGFGIYPALEAAAPGEDPAGSAPAVRAQLRHAAAARPGGPPRQGWRRARSAWPHWPAAPRSRRHAAGPGTPGEHEQGVLPGIDIP